MSLLEQTPDMLSLKNVLERIEGLTEIFECSESVLYKKNYYDQVVNFVYNSMHFEIAIPKSFPYRLPYITLLDKIVHSHIDERGVVCLPSVDEIVYDVSDQESIIKLSITALKKLFLMDEQENQKEILYEYNDYLGIYSNRNYEITPFLFEDLEKGYICIHEKLCFIGSNELLEDYKEKNKIATLTNYSYLRLDLCSLPKVKYDSISSEDIISCLTDDSLSSLKKYRNNSIKQFYLLRYKNPDFIYNYILITVENDKPNLKANGLLSNLKLKITPVQNRTFSFLRERGGSKVFESKVLVIGCGSVGSEICELLASSGFVKIDIVDADDLKFENGYRNSSGFYYLYLDKLYSKVLTCKAYIETKFPDTNITIFERNVVDLIESGKLNLNEYKYIVSCTGNSIVDNYLNNYLYKNNIKTYLVFSWLEPYGIAEHILSIDTEKKGCFECLLKSSYNIQLCSNENEYYKKRNNVCSGSFTPYGRISTVRLASNTVEIIVNNELDYERILNRHIIHKGNVKPFLNMGFKKTKFMDYTDEKLNEHSRDYIREGCNTCGKLDY